MTPLDCIPLAGIRHPDIHGVEYLATGSGMGWEMGGEVGGQENTAVSG